MNIILCSRRAGKRALNEQIRELARAMVERGECADETEAVALLSDAAHRPMGSL